MLSLILAIALLQQAADTTLTFQEGNRYVTPLMTIDASDRVWIGPELAAVCDPEKLRRAAIRSKRYRSKSAGRYINDCMKKTHRR